jgi:hypothetical protein
MALFPAVQSRVVVENDQAEAAFSVTNKSTAAGSCLELLNYGTEPALTAKNAGLAPCAYLNGGQRVKRTPTAVSYQVLVTDFIVAVTNTDAARTITLPTAAAAKGQWFLIVDESGAANTNNVIIRASGSETISGSGSSVINKAYGSKLVYSTGTAWFTTAISNPGSSPSASTSSSPSASASASPSSSPSS